MTGEADTKVCPQCAETIRAQAKLCPYCRSRQNGIGVWRNEIAFGIIAVVWLVLALVTSELCFSWGARGRDFGPHQGDLQVIRTRMERIGRTTNFTLTGYVTNQGDYAWRVEEFEVRFVDASGRLLDAEHPDNEDDFVVQPKQEHAFRLNLYNVTITNSDTTETARVTAARDGNYRKWSD